MLANASEVYTEASLRCLDEECNTLLTLVHVFCLISCESDVVIESFLEGLFIKVLLFFNIFWYLL